MTWEAFCLQTATAPTSSSLKERILQRQLLAKSPVSASSVIADQTNRALRQKVDFIEERVQAALRTECVGSGLFPPLQMGEWAGSEPEESFFVLTFEPSTEYALTAYLQVWFSLRLIDHASTGISISVTASLSVSSLTSASTATVKPNACCTKGLFDEGVVGTKLQMLLYQILDEALAKGADFSDKAPSAVWLNCALPEAA